MPSTETIQETLGDTYEIPCRKTLRAARRLGIGIIAASACMAIIDLVSKKEIHNGTLLGIDLGVGVWFSSFMLEAVTDEPYSADTVHATTLVE